MTVDQYAAVRKALESGTEPARLCEMCPWDRYCITPPCMTREEVRQAVADMERQHAGAGPLPSGGAMERASLATIAALYMYAGRDTDTPACPVLVLRLRSSTGRGVVDSIKAMMQAHNDDLPDQPARQGQ